MHGLCRWHELMKEAWSSKPQRSRCLSPAEDKRLRECCVSLGTISGNKCIDGALYRVPCALCLYLAAGRVAGGNWRRPSSSGVPIKFPNEP